MWVQAKPDGFELLCARDMSREPAPKQKNLMQTKVSDWRKKGLLDKQHTVSVERISSEQEWTQAIVRSTPIDEAIAQLAVLGNRAVHAKRRRAKRALPCQPAGAATGDGHAR